LDLLQPQASSAHEKPRRIAPAGSSGGGVSPEEIVDHIYDFAGVDIDKHDIVIIPNPLVWAIDGRQAIVRRIIHEKARLEEQAVEIEPDS
jgi:hypothetical protein